MSMGSLYKLSNSEFIGSVNYQLLREKGTNWWGELTLEDHVRLDDGDRYIIELEDKRMSQCRLKRIVNRAVSGIPPHWVYHVTGTSLLE